MIKKSTLIRTILLIIAIANSALALMDKSPLPIDDAMIEDLVSFGFTTVMAFVTWWKNNSFTDNAIKADEFLEELRKSEEA